MKHILLLTFICVTLMLTAQTPLPYYTGFDNSQEQAGWVEFRKGNASLYQWNYNPATHFTSPNSLSHNYPVGGSQVTEDWFVSPEFDFTNGGKIDSIRYLFSGFGVPQNGDTVAIYLLNGSPDPDLATSVTLLKDYRGNDYNNDNTWRVDTGIVIPAISGESYLAFRYHTIINWLDVRFDNLSVSGNIGAGVHQDLSKEKVKIYPNPASDFVIVESSANEWMNIEIFDLSGKLIEEKQFSGRGEVGLKHIKKGMIFLKISCDEQIFFKKLMVQ